MSVVQFIQSEFDAFYILPSTDPFLSTCNMQIHVHRLLYLVLLVFPQEIGDYQEKCDQELRISLIFVSIKNAIFVNCPHIIILLVDHYR